MSAVDSATSVAAADARSADSVEEMSGIEGPMPTIIVGKIVERWIDSERFEGDQHPCDRSPCEAKVEVIALTQIGNDFNGEIEAGEVLKVHFDFSLNPTDALFPELNTPLDGLLVDDLFQASIQTSTDTDHADRYRINVYEKIKK
ncbi:MAG: hypothetical protein RLP15_13100 [Cryomorphaceae bacterium]